MDTVYNFYHWARGLDMLQVLLYFILPPLALVFVVDWFRDFLRPHR